MTNVVLPTGLFPHNLSSRQVLVEDDRSPTGQGTCSLSADELADLWDLPLLLQELAPDVKGGANSITALLRSPPVKIISLGGDALLGNYFRAKEQAEVRPVSKRRWPGPLLVSKT